MNAMRQDWVGENGWANPPFHLLGPVISKIVATGAAVTLVAPVWRSQPWWRRDTEAATAWRLLPPEAGVFVHDSRSTPAPTPCWRTAVFRFADSRVCATTTTGGSCSSRA